MRKLNIIGITALLWMFLLSPLHSQDLPSIINKLCGGKWTGYYQNSDDSSLLHVLEWRIDYEGKVVRAYKSVPELDFFMETIIFYDYEHDSFAALSLLTKSLISKGIISFDKNSVEIIGKSFFPKGSSEFRIEYKLNDRGQLEDRFYRKVNGEWTQGHLILYDRKKATAGK